MFAERQPDGTQRVVLNDVDRLVLACSFGNYPWDGWEKKALARGVSASLATLGRAVMREAYQHSWSDRLKSLCGWKDEGERMIRLALRSPETAERRWAELLGTDGQIGRVDPETGDWKFKDAS